MSRHHWFLPFWLTAVALTASADETKDVQDWLEKMSRAVKSQNYQGVFVYLHGTQLEAMHIAHSGDGERDQERLISLNGAAREVLRDKDSVTCIVPDAKQVFVDRHRSRRQFPALLPIDIGRLAPYYTFQFLGSDRVAGRLTRVIGIIPQDSYRYGYRLYLDQDTALPLKSDLMDDTGIPVAQIMFTSIEIDPALTISDLTQEAERLGLGFKRSTREHGKNQVNNLRWRFGKLPDGFSLSAHHQWVDTSNDTPVEHLVLSDGLASLSVYVERMRQQVEGLEGGSRIGAVNAWGRSLAGYQVTAVGEVPQKTARMVVDFLEYASVD